MATISFFVPGAPTGKQRPRHGQGRTYTPPQTVAAEKAIGWYAKEAMLKSGHNAPFEKPIRLHVMAYYKRPESWPKRRLGETWKATKPDLDNILKLVKDGLNKVAWQDDAQVAFVTATKEYSSGPEGMTITILELEHAQRD